MGEYCDALGLKTKKYTFPTAGPALAASTAPGELPPIALMGHLDTVHPVGSFGEHAFRKDVDRVYGPGVYDCKGGVAAGFFALRALLQAGYQKRQLRMLLIGDEETAHELSDGESLRLYREHGKGCAAAFNLESGILNGDVITRRKGGGVVSFTFQGIASHAGSAPEKGASAIREAARKILDIEALTDFSTGVTCNCGVIRGGRGVNVIPDICEVQVGLRFPTLYDKQITMEQLRMIENRIYTPGVLTRMEVRAGFEAMEPTPRTDDLFAVYQNASEALGYGKPGKVYSGGCSDAAYVALEGVPVLCGVGVRGAGNHSLKEYALISSLKERAKILVRTILSLPDDF